MTTKPDIATKRDLTVPEAAAYLGVAEKDIRAYINNGELPHAWNKAISKSSRARYRIPQSDLETFKRSRQVVPAGRLEEMQPRLRLRKFRTVY